MCAVYIAYKRVTDRPVEANSRALFFVFEVYLLNAYAKMRQEKNNRISKHKITTYESRSCVNSTPERSRCREMHFGSFVLSVDSIARILVFVLWTLKIYEITTRSPKIHSKRRHFRLDSFVPLVLGVDRKRDGLRPRAQITHVELEREIVFPRPDLRAGCTQTVAYGHAFKTKQNMKRAPNELRWMLSLESTDPSTTG